MPGEGTPSTEVRPPEAPKAKKLQRKIKPKEVKGFYYHATEYQRQKQKERNGVHRFFRGLIEPIAIQVRAARLKHAASKYGGGGSAVLDSQFVRQALDKFWGKGLDPATKERFKTKAQLHQIFEQYDINKEDAVRIQEVTTEIFSKKGSITAEEVREFADQTGLSLGEVNRIVNTAKENTDGYITADEMKGKFTEEAIYSGLTQEQQQEAKKLAHAAKRFTYTAGARIGVIAFLVTNPAGWFTAAGIAGSAILGAVGRGFQLHTEGKTYGISKSRGIDVTQHRGKGFLAGIGRLMTIDWEEDHKGWQYARAIGFGTAIAVCARFAPAIFEHVGELGQHVGTDIHAALDNAGAAGHVGHEASQTFSSKPVEIQIPHVRDGELRVPNGWHFGEVQHHQNPNFLYDNQGHKVASHFFADKGGNTHFTYDNGYASSHGIDHLQQTIPLSHRETDAFNAFVNEHGTNLKIAPPAHNLPAGGHEAYGMTDYSDGKSLTIQAYDHLGDQANALEMTVNGHHLVFLPTEYVHGHPAWQFTPGNNSHMVTMWQDGHELQVTSGQAANMLHITYGALQDWMHSGHPAGVSSDFDYRIGQNILGHNLIFGHLDKSSGVLDQLGVIRGHAGLNGELTGTKFGERVYDFMAKLGQESPLKGDHEEALHSVFAGPLQWIDNAEDRLLEVFRGSVFSNSFIHRLDEISDFGLRNTDYDASAIPRLWAERPWYIGGVLLPYVGAGYAGYLYGKSRAGKKLTFPRAGLNAAMEGAMFTLLPGTAVTATLFYWIGKMRNKKKEEKTPTHTETNPETRPANSGGPSNTGGSTVTPGAIPVQSANLAAPIASVQSTVAGSDDGLIPAPLYQTTPEDLQTTAAEEENPSDGSVPPAHEEALEATLPVGQFTAPHAEGGEIYPTLETTQPIVAAQILNPGEDRLQQIIKAQHILSENLSGKERVQLYSQLKDFPAGRVLQMLEAAKRENPSVDPETLLSKAIVSASVVDWNPQEGELAIEQELEPQDIKEISQALFGDTTDEHVNKVEEAYRKYQKGNVERQEAASVQETHQEEKNPQP